MATRTNLGELPIVLVPPKDLPARPKHIRGSKNILPKLWEKYPNVAILPPEAFKATETAQRRADKRQARLDKDWRNARDRRRYRAEPEKARKKWRRDDARQRADPVRRENRNARDRAYRASPKGQAAQQAYYARVKDEKNRKKRERYATDPVYRQAQIERAQQRYRRNKETAEHGIQ